LKKKDGSKASACVQSSSGVLGASFYGYETYITSLFAEKGEFKIREKSLSHWPRPFREICEWSWPTFPVFRTFSHVLQLQFFPISQLCTSCMFGDSHASFFRGRYSQVAERGKTLGKADKLEKTSVGGPRKPEKIEELKCFPWLLKQRKSGEIRHPLIPENCSYNRNISLGEK